MKGFGIHPGQRVSVLIDGPSFYATTRSLGYEVDYRKLLAHFDEGCDLRRIHYFTALSDRPDEHSPVRPLVDWLGYNGYRCVTKPLREFTDANGFRRVKGNMAVEIAVELVEAANHADHILLFSGEGDLACAVEMAQRKGAKVTAISDDLRRACDCIVDLNDVKPLISRKDIVAVAQDDIPQRRPAGVQTLRLGARA